MARSASPAASLASRRTKEKDEYMLPTNRAARLHNCRSTAGARSGCMSMVKRACKHTRDAHAPYSGEGAWTQRGECGHGVRPVEACLRHDDEALPVEVLDLAEIEHAARHVQHA